MPSPHVHSLRLQLTVLLIVFTLKCDCSQHSAFAQLRPHLLERIPPPTPTCLCRLQSPHIVLIFKCGIICSAMTLLNVDAIADDIVAHV